MRSLPIMLVAALLVGTTMPGAAAERARKRADTVDRSRDVDRDAKSRASLTRREAQIIRRYYEPRVRNLPPGLQKKLARTGTLPPGWQEKVQAFPPSIERQLPRLPSGYRRGHYDGYAVLYDARSGRIIDLDGPYWR